MKILIVLAIIGLACFIVVMIGCWKEVSQINKDFDALNKIITDEELKRQKI